MAVYVYGLAFGNIADEVPFISGTLTPTSEPITSTLVTQWIEDGSAELNAALVGYGITPSATMDETDHAALLKVVKAYGVSKCLLVLGATGPVYDQARLVWDNAIAKYTARPQNLGTSSVALTSTTIDDITVDSGVATHADLGTENWSFISMNGNDSW